MSRPGHCTPGKKIHYPLNSSLGGLQDESGWFWRRANTVSLPGFKPLTVQLLASHSAIYPVLFDSVSKREVSILSISRPRF